MLFIWYNKLLLLNHFQMLFVRALEEVKYMFSI